VDSITYIVMVVGSTPTRFRHNLSFQQLTKNLAPFQKLGTNSTAENSFRESIRFGPVFFFCVFR
jgi:hypothetical protein